MKKILLLILIICFTNSCFTNSLSAQSKKVIGSWKLVYENYVDTLDQGREEMNKDSKAYYNGSKKLSSEYIQVTKVYPKKEEAHKIIITEEKGILWLKSGVDSKVKLTYNPKTNNYTFPQRWPGETSFSFKYSDKSKNLIFKDRKSRNITEEFSKI